MGTSMGFMDAFDKRVASRFRDVKVPLVIEGTLVRVPVILLRMGEWDSFHIEGGKGINDKLVERSGFQDLFGEGGVEHIDLEMGKKHLEGIIL